MKGLRVIGAELVTDVESRQCARIVPGPIELQAKLVFAVPIGRLFGSPERVIHGSVSNCRGQESISDSSNQGKPFVCMASWKAKGDRSGANFDLNEASCLRDAIDASVPQDERH